MDIPVPEQELGGRVTLVPHHDVVREYEGAILRIGVGEGKAGLNPYTDTVGGLLVAHDEC